MAGLREDCPRRCTQWATTNDDAYLASQTGNRRFWPLAVGQINIDALRRDRDQLWGEAAALEAKGASIVLDPALWPAATEEQEKRRLVDTWEDVIESMLPVWKSEMAVQRKRKSKSSTTRMVRSWFAAQMCWSMSWEWQPDISTQTMRNDWRVP